MSTKRSRGRTSEVKPASPLPASKRLKTTPNSHVPTKTGLGFLVDEDARTGRRLEARLTNGVPKTKSTRVDESHALVAPDTKDDEDAAVNGKPHEVINISSGEEESSEYESEDEEEQAGKARRGVVASTAKKPTMNGHISDSENEEDAKLGAEDDRMEGVQHNGAAPEASEAEAEAEEPSFGDMLQARHPNPIDVQASLSGPSADRSALVPANNNRSLAAPSTTSLGTVLTQALRTNDKDLLESCFQVTDLPSIRSTIQRLQSPHASILLQRLAERIHKRPGRTSNLMVWVQWTLVTHGGYMATQPEVMKKLRSLAQVVRERASGLQPLLHLKGKLDLLSAQLELRRNMGAVSRVANAIDEDEEEAVLYVEGQDDDWSDDEDVAMEDRPKLLQPPKSKLKGQVATPETDMSESDDDGESEDGLPNGVAHESEDESDEDEREDVEGLLDQEAEETSDDDVEEASSDEEESDAESEDSTEPSEDESEPEIKQPQPKMLNRKR